MGDLLHLIPKLKKAEIVSNTAYSKKPTLVVEDLGFYFTTVFAPHFSETKVQMWKTEKI